MSNRHKSLLGALLIFSIGSLLTFSNHSLSDDSDDWVISRSSNFSSSSSPLKLSSTEADRTGANAQGTDLDAAFQDYSKLSHDTLQRIIRGSILDTNEDLLDPTRSIRPKDLEMISKLNPMVDDLHPDTEEDVDGEDGGEEDYVGDDDDDDHSHNDPTSIDPEEGVNNLETPAEPPLGDEHSEDNDDEPESGMDQSQDPKEDEDSHKGELDTEYYDIDNDEENTENEDAATDDHIDQDTSLADFDANKVLPPSDSYLLFVPSGETIEAQFFSLLTSLWIAKHSNRTLIIPPPMMSSPMLNHLYPFFAGPMGKKRQRWSKLFDLRVISQYQPIVLIDNTRPVLQIPFTTEMAQEEENPSSNFQSVPFETGHATPPIGTIPPFKIQCHGPPTAGSWKALDFAGRHFLNRYNLLAEFEILKDPYWSLKPEAVQKHWGASPRSGSGSGSGFSLPNEQDERHRQLICITGADLIGTEDPAMEEMIWQEIGLFIPFASGVKLQGQTSIVQTLRGLEKEHRRNGYIGVHIDKLPSREFCRRGLAPAPVEMEHSKKEDDPSMAAEMGRTEPEPAHSTDNDPNDHVMAAGAAFSTTHPAVMTPSQCLWTVDLIAKRIAILQQTEGKMPRPVIVTTTETDPELLAKMDQQPGWIRMSSGDEIIGLFDSPDGDLGGYGDAVARAFVMANSAIFVGSRTSALGVHAAFRIKNEGRNKRVPPRWELY
ncbi:hypothetical protein BG011_009039 [Mortierella polycephala]|uniref:Uncharacterized protein n=1 Tax=Mortierella polycephala TaxID=41804 RepID=A0A9P6PLX1_9FUNG|nr:hypothetical protein BG011_009039 [Mortierella polycephala]